MTTLILTLSSCAEAATEYPVAPGDSIQAAVNNASSGDVIIVAPGTYTENIIINKNDLTIRSGAGNPANTIISANNPGVSVISIQNGNNVTIEGFKITGAGTNTSGVYLTGSNYCTIEDNVLYNNYLGIRISGSRGNRLSENTVNLSASHGIVMENTTGSIIENNDVNSSGIYGIYLYYADSNNLTSNTMFNNTNNGINLVFSSGNTVSGNTVFDDTLSLNTHSIFLNNSHNNNLQSNTVSNCDYGIAMRYSNNNNLVNNNAYNNNRGIYLTLTSSINTLSGNQANSNLMNGIILDNAGNNNLINNTARLNTASGIVLGNARDNTLTNNSASGNSKGIYVLTSASGNTLSGNVVNSNTGNGIQLENVSNNNLTGNTASSNGVYGIYLASSSNNYLIGNIASSNSKGIYLMTSSGNMISNNTVSNNTVHNTSNGIMLSLSDNNILYMNKAISNTYGISLNSSKNNNVSSNNVTSSTSNGLFLCAQSTNNRIYNNYLNNTMNVNNKNSGSTWNTTKASGASIVGGSSIGGNYWANPSGTGFSQLNAAHDSNGDGIIDFKYDGDNLTDYYPLLAVYVPEPVYPIANFTTNVTSGNAPLAVLFTDNSQNATGWNWNFGDGTNSTERNTTHTYSSVGNYSVNLTVSNANGTDSKTTTLVVLQEQGGNGSNGLPVVDFSANVTSGYAPLSVMFTDLSQNATSRIWDFTNDGTGDADVSPVVYVYTAPGIYTVNLTSGNQNGTKSKLATITVSSKEEEHHSSGGSSHSSGGGGGSPEPARNVDVKELSQTFITNGKETKFNFTKNATCVVYVGFDAKKTVGKTTTIVEQLKNKSTLVSVLSEGEVYRYFNVWVGNSGFATSKNIDNPVLCFKVEKSWIQDKKIDKDSITLNRYSDKKWEQLSVDLSGEDSKYLYFTADVPAYSFFAVTGKTDVSSEETVTEIQPEDESDNSEENMGDTGSEEADQGSDEDESPGTPGFEMIYGIAGLLAVSLYKRK
ncbi:NosD domain-containing protein [Methanosarcina sp. DH2]|uniref:NosD domain-containing protein n=1 Tax=Methanosarcina sp. DH2 TaxID=2605639 RepID=UPI001E3D3C3A|nr:NosD domain-containing protein [Methanosarcina sp. DH2]